MEGQGFLIQNCEESSLFECNCKVHKLYLIAQSGEGPLESTLLGAALSFLKSFFSEK